MAEDDILTEGMFDESSGSDFEIIEIGDRFDSCYGTNFLCVTREDIAALMCGKALYTNDGEYATLIKLTEKGENDA